MTTGMGVVGQLAMRPASGIRTETLIAADLVEDRLEKAKAGGATRALNPQTSDLKSRMQEITRERGLDVVIDFMDFHLKELVLSGCHQPKCPIHPTSLFPWTQQYNLGQILLMIADGRLPVNDLISHRLPAAEADRGYELLRERRQGALGVVLNWK